MTVCLVDKENQNSLTNVNFKNHDFILFCSDQGDEKYIFTECLGRIGEYHVHDGIFESISNSKVINFLEGFVELNVDKDVLRNIFCTKKLMELNGRFFVNLNSAYHASRTADNKTCLKAGSQNLTIDIAIDDFIEKMSVDEKKNLHFLSSSISDKNVVIDGHSFNSIIFKDSIMIVEIMHFNDNLLSMFLFKNGTRLEVEGDDVLEHRVSSLGNITFEK